MGQLQRIRLKAAGMKAAKAEGADVKALQEKVEAQDKEIKELREMVEKLVAKA